MRQIFTMHRIRFIKLLSFVLWTLQVKLMKSQDGETTPGIWDTADCPHGMEQFQQYCYLMVENTSFPYDCPFKSTTTYNSNAITSVSEDGIWLNVRRSETYGYYEWIDIEENYGRLFDISAPVGENCMLKIYSNTWRSEDCNKKYKGVCVYALDDSGYCDAYNKICNEEDCCPRQSKETHFCGRSCSNRSDGCATCKEKFAQYPEPTIKLTYNRNSAVIVVVENSLKMVNLNYGLPFYCFTDVYVASRSYISYRYELQEILLMQEDFDKLTYTFSIQAQAVGYYWCQGFRYPDFGKVDSNKILAGVPSNFGLNFVLNVTLLVEAFSFLYYDLTTLPITYLNVLVPQQKYQLIRPVKVLPLYNNQTNADLVFHLTTYPNVSDIEGTHQELLEQLVHYNANFEGIQNYSFSSSQFCISSEDENTSFTLSWPTTIVGQQTAPREMYLQDNGLPIMRRCLGDFMSGAYWSEVIGTVSPDIGSEITEDLYELFRSNKTAEERNSALGTIIGYAEDVIPYDLYLIANIFEQIAQSGQEFDLARFTRNLHLVTEIDVDTLQAAQSVLNATDAMLYNFDLALANAIYQNGGINDHGVAIRSGDLIARVSNLKSTGVRGVAIYDVNDELQIRDLVNVTSLADIDLIDLRFAAFIPPKLLDQIFEAVNGPYFVTAATQSNSTQPKLLAQVFSAQNTQHEGPILVTAMFLNDALFRDEYTEAVSVILSIFVPGFLGIDLEEPLPVIFRSSEDVTKDAYCSYWRYGIDEMLASIYGKWEIEQNANLHLQEFRICNYSHMTHFALLAGAPENKILNLISLIGCVLSLVGVAGIAITAIVFKSWRDSSATKILLNFSATIAIEIVFLFFSNLSTKAEIWCSVVGVVLHYTIISQFCWMLVIGYLQYRKFVQVLIVEARQLVLKSCLFGWLVPTIPVIITFSISGGSYGNQNSGFCYPSGLALYLGIFLPIGCVIVVNLVVFVAIFASISCKNSQAFGEKQNLGMLKVNLAAILFFLMGFSWVFGLLAQLFDSIVLSYLFCATSTVQGLVMYVYFVVLNKTVRRLWSKKLQCASRLVEESDTYKTKNSNSNRFDFSKSTQ